MTDHFMRRPVATIRRKKKNGTKFIIGILILTIAAAGWFWYQNTRYEYFIKTPVDPSDNTKISFTVKKGESPLQIGKNLKGKDLILDEDSFRNYLRANGMDRKVVAGRFLLNKTQTVPDIAGIITDSKQSEFIITVPEGSTITDIDEKLVEMEVIKPGDFVLATKNFSSWDKYPFLDKEKSSNLVHPLEGYLFPDTYYIDPQNFRCEDLIQLMLNNFKKKLEDELDNDHGRSLFEIITMASIIEKETSLTEEKPLVSAVFHNRLKKKIPLQSDPTVIYGIKNFNGNLTKNDLQRPTPYNTYLRTGLPPSPICNPGKDSLLAALHPAPVPYLYFVSKNDGSHYFSSDLEDHNRAVWKYQKLGKKNNLTKK